MQHFISLDNLNFSGCWLTIGTFDGVHLGHKYLIGKLSSGAHASGLPAVVLTFFPHPAVILGKRTYANFLTTPEERAELLGNCGADVVITFPFSKMVAEMSAQEFMNLLCSHLAPKHLIIGSNFALGHDRKGDLQTLTDIGRDLGYSVEGIPPVELDGSIVSSSRIRSALFDGNIDLANRLLGREYHVNGQVVHGDGRGKLIGIPTANLEIPPEFAIPKTGVYVSKARIGEKIWHSVTNIGVRPTFDSNPAKPHIETHLIDFDSEIYGTQITLSFITRLRNEQRFESVPQLVAQINKDIQHTRQILLSLEQ
jgi:riboflavin kinase / FMN adenylyltransferase